jgi:hypothetical protein
MSKAIVNFREESESLREEKSPFSSFLDNGYPNNKTGVEP